MFSDYNMAMKTIVDTAVYIIETNLMSGMTNDQKGLRILPAYCQLVETCWKSI